MQRHTALNEISMTERLFVAGLKHNQSRVDVTALSSLFGRFISVSLSVCASVATHRWHEHGQHPGGLSLAARDEHQDGGDDFEREKDTLLWHRFLMTSSLRAWLIHGFCWQQAKFISGERCIRVSHLIAIPSNRTLISRTSPCEPSCDQGCSRRINYYWWPAKIVRESALGTTCIFWFSNMKKKSIYLTVIIIMYSSCFLWMGLRETITE